MANPAINFAGFLYDDAGDAVSGATINLYDKNTSTTSRANTTTNSSGYWSIAHTTNGEFDVQITSGSSKRRIKFDDKIHLSEVDTETLNVRGNEGQPAPMYWFADDGDDAGDRWLFNAAAGGVFTMGNDLNSQGTYVAHVTITPNATVANSTFAVAGNLTVGNALTVTGTTTLNGNLVLGDAAADTLTVGATLQGASPLTFEGGTADGYETTFAITDPTADRTITFPNLTGTVQLSGNPITGTTIDASTDFTIGNTVITDGVVTDSTGLQLAANLDIDGTVDISGDLTLSAGGDGALVFATAGENSIKIPDNQASALIIEEANNAYITFVTTNSSEAITVAKNTTFSGIVDITDSTDSSDASGDTGALRTEGGASIAKKLYVGTDLDVDGTAELDNITIGGAQGSDGQVLTSTGSGVAWEAVSSTASVATTVTITDNESTNEDNAIIFTAGGDVDGGNLGLESDGTLTYNPSTGKITATGFIGSLTGTADTATVATTVTITDNESTNEDNAIIFTAGGDVDGGNIGLESDGTLTYNPSTGKVTATGFIGAIDGILGANSAAALTATTGVFSTSIDVTGSTGIILENDETITNSVNGTVLINGNLKVGSGSGAGVYASNGNHDVTLQTGNSTTGSITIVDGSNGTITLSPNGTGTSVIEDPVLTVGSDADGDIYYRASSKVARLAKGTADQVLTMNDGATAPGWEDAGGGGGTTTLVAEGPIVKGQGVAVNAQGKAEAISGWAEFNTHPNVHGVDIGPIGTSHQTAYYLLPIVHGSIASTHARVWGTSGWGDYIHVQMGTYTKTTNTMVWGTSVRLDTKAHTGFRAMFDATSGNIIIAGDSSSSIQMIVVEPHATNNTIYEADGSGHYDHVVATIDAGGAAADSRGIGLASAGSLDLGHGDGALSSILIAYVDSNDASEAKLACWQIRATHALAETVANVLVSTNGEACTGIQMGFEESKGIVVYQNGDDSSYTFCKGFDLTTGGSPSIDVDTTALEPFGADKKVMMGHASIENWMTTQLSYDDTNNVWLITGQMWDGDSDKVVPVASVTLSAASPPVAESVEVSLDEIDEPPAGSRSWGNYGPYLGQDGLTSAAHIATLDVVREQYQRPSIAFDPDRKCHVLMYLQYGYHYEADTGQHSSAAYPVIYTITTDADGTNITSVYQGNLDSGYVRNNDGATKILWGAYDGGQPIEGAHIIYDTDNDMMLFNTVGDISYIRSGATAHESDKIVITGAFRGRTTTAALGAIGSDATEDAKTRALVYGPSNMRSFIGIADAESGGDWEDDDTVTIHIAGGLNEVQSGLTVGERYFISDDGLIRNQIPGVTSYLYRAGVSTASTKLLVDGSTMNKHT